MREAFKVRATVRQERRAKARDGGSRDTRIISQQRSKREGLADVGARVHDGQMIRRMVSNLMARSEQLLDGLVIGIGVRDNC